MSRVGITIAVEKRDGPDEYSVPADYISAVFLGGAVPVLLPPVEEKSLLDAWLSSIDGLLLTGGDDISPVLYGEENTGLSMNVSRQRDEAELYLLGGALRSGIPVLGICRGFQLINVFFGGKLYQDIGTEKSGSLTHRNRFNRREELHHTVNIEKNTRLYSIIGSSVYSVNSRHHQGVKEIGEGLTVSARADDGIIEAFEHKEMDIIAVQWHPENLVGLGTDYKSLFNDLTQRCRDGSIYK